MATDDQAANTNQGQAQGQAINLDAEKQRHFEWLLEMSGPLVAGVWTKQALRDLVWHFHNEGFEHGSDKMFEALRTGGM